MAQEVKVVNDIFLSALEVGVKSKQEVQCLPTIVFGRCGRKKKKRDPSML